MEKSTTVFLAIPALYILVNWLNISVSKIKIRKESKKRGWKIIKVRFNFKETFLESASPLNKTVFDVYYEDRDGVIMNPDMYVKFWGLSMDIHQNYPISREQKIDT